MNNPTLSNGVTTVTLPMPSGWEVVPIIGENVSRSIGGVELIDTTYRKNQYILVWDAMWSSDFEALVNLINGHIDDGDNLVFVFDKFPESYTPGIQVTARMSSRKMKAGSGQAFYSSTQLTLTELNPR